MNPIPHPALGRRLRRAAWQCLLLILAGLALSGTARTHALGGSATEAIEATPADAGDVSAGRVRSPHRA